MSSMPSALDYAYARPSIAQLKAAGITAVIRYLGGGPKAITPLELVYYVFNGISVGLVYENTATDAQSGAAGGVAHARAALAALQVLNLPPDQPVFYAVDESINPPDALPYFQGIASVVPVRAIGDYGEGALSQLLDQDKLSTYHWQSESTSFPGNATLLPITCLWQKYNAAPIAATDLDLILKPDFGQFPRPAKPAPPPPVINNYPGDNMQSVQTQVQISGGHGWIPSPVPAAKVVTAIVLDTNPEDVGAYAGVPGFEAVATQAGPHSPNGALTFKGPDGTWGVAVWYVN